MCVCVDVCGYVNFLERCNELAGRAVCVRVRGVKS